MKLMKAFPILAMLLIVFVAGCDKDDDPGIRPVVISTNPITSSTSTAINSNVTATFSVAMKAASISSSTFTLEKNDVPVAGTVSYSGTSATFSPAENLSPNTLYTATILAAATNEAGTSLGKDYSWTFTTNEQTDVVLPTVTLINPANNAVGVIRTSSIDVTFSEAMDATTLTGFTFAVRQGTTSVAGTVTYGGSIATFTPTTAFAANQVYSVILSTGVKDMAGNALAVAFTSAFTTSATADAVVPTITSTDPLNAATGVATNKVVSVVFSEAMSSASINATTFSVKQGANTVAGAVNYSGTTATFIASALFAANTVYTATLSTGAKDLAGNALAATTTWSFTTGSTASTLSVVNLGAAANYVILAKTAVNNNPTSVITGDIGLSPAATSFLTGFSLTNATGFATASQVTGKLYAADMADPTPINLTTAVENMITAYNDAAGRTTPDFLELGTGNLGGRTLTPGLYKWTNTVTLPSDVTLSGGANDVWIFQIAQDLTVSNSVNITLTGGAQAKNIFWQVAGTVTIGTTSHFEGVILSMTGITLQTGASLKGRALAQTAVVLDASTVTKPN